MESIDLEASMQRELDTLWGNTNEAKNFTIFRTPHNISQSKKNLFEPSVISIGPFHYGQEHLRALEEQKWRFLRDFLSRGDHISLNLCISEMKFLETRARGCYSETFDDLDSNAFVKMMLLDGCFVLEYLFKFFEGNVGFIFEVGWYSNFVVCDFLLLENQIPFFIVDKLYKIGTLDQQLRIMDFVKHTAFIFLYRILSKDELDYSIDSIPDPPTEIHHLVHLCYHYSVPNPEIPVVLSSNRIIKVLFHRFRSRVLRRRLSVTLSNSTGNISSMVIPSATQLKQTGLKFTPKRNPKHMLDISFEYGVLKIPKIVITDDTKPIFANFIAFENSKYGKENSPFTTFVTFLYNLVKTQNDVTILQECGIIENWLESEEELAHSLSQVTEGTAIKSNHYLVELYTGVNEYIISNRSKARWNRQREKLIREYFSSPWKAISLFAAFILLVLTCIQTFYAVYAYKFPPRS